MDLRILDRPSAWDLGNEVLYRLCAEYPEHTDPEVVIAKVWLIGRAYAAPLERGRAMPGGLQNEGFYTGRVAPLVLASPIDQWLNDLRRVELGWDALPQILLAHRRVTDLFLEISGRAQRSLASKYLHFHRPDLFFIYDARAEKAVRGEVRRPPRIEVEKTEHDADYSLFVRRCLTLVDATSERGLTPRQLDRVLLGY